MDNYQIGKCECGKIDKLHKYGGNWFLPAKWLCWCCYFSKLWKSN